MKNTMKKLLSLVLVAMLLVCAVPFQAAATEADETLTVKTYVDGKYVTDKYVTVKPGQKLEPDEGTGRDSDLRRQGIRQVDEHEGRRDHRPHQL